MPGRLDPDVDAWTWSTFLDIGRRRLDRFGLGDLARRPMRNSSPNRRVAAVVVVHAEHQLAGGRSEPGPAPEHLEYISAAQEAYPHYRTCIESTTRFVVRACLW